MTASRPATDPPPSPFLAESDGPRRPTPSRRARQLLQLAHQAVYRLPADFPGFTAAVEASSDQWTVRGTVAVHCPHGSVFTLDADDPGHDHVAGAGSRPSPATVTTLIVDLVSWQFPKRFDELDGRYEAGFRPDLDQPGRRAVQLLGESRRTIRWLDERGVIATAYRRAGTAHHLDVLERRILDDERWLPAEVADLRQAEGIADQRHVHADEFVDVDGVHLPLRRSVSVTTDGEPATTSVTIELRDHRHHPRHAPST